MRITMILAVIGLAFTLTACDDAVGESACQKRYTSAECVMHTDAVAISKALGAGVWTRVNDVYIANASERYRVLAARADGKITVTVQVRDDLPLWRAYDLDARGNLIAVRGQIAHYPEGADPKDWAEVHRAATEFFLNHKAQEG
ncbi:MAG: hypothetical protein WDN10_05465 [bacterium]